MSEPKFTKGEWVLKIGCTEAAITTESGITLIHHSCVDSALGAMRVKERKANAHLIASAPAMYEALEDAADLLFQYDAEANKCSRDIRKLLAKARGEA